jgi:hypothetical protein
MIRRVAFDKATINHLVHDPQSFNDQRACKHMSPHVKVQSSCCNAFCSVRSGKLHVFRVLASRRLCQPLDPWPALQFAEHCDAIRVPVHGKRRGCAYTPILDICDDLVQDLRRGITRAPVSHPGLPVSLWQCYLQLHGPDLTPTRVVTLA